MYFYAKWKINQLRRKREASWHFGYLKMPCHCRQWQSILMFDVTLYFLFAYIDYSVRLPNYMSFIWIKLEPFMYDAHCIIKSHYYCSTHREQEKKCKRQKEKTEIRIRRQKHFPLQCVCLPRIVFHFINWTFFGWKYIFGMCSAMPGNFRLKTQASCSNWKLPEARNS